ncbi:MAG: hypothetical protein M0P12_06360 [Paludibacteraceae bacterium]|nr:hypothetical protein [Paludibacteraceae bacterium]
MNISSEKITKQIFSLVQKINAPKDFLPIEYIQGREGLFFEADDFGKIHFISTTKN